MCKLGLPPGWFPAVLPGFILNLLAAVGATVQTGLGILSRPFFGRWLAFSVLRMTAFYLCFNSSVPLKSLEEIILRP